MTLKLSWLLRPSNVSWGAGIARSCGPARLERRWRAPSPAKPLSFTRGPRSGRISRTLREASREAGLSAADLASSLRGGEASNAVAFTNLGTRSFLTAADDDGIATAAATRTDALGNRLRAGNPDRLLDKDVMGGPLRYRRLDARAPAGRGVPSGRAAVAFKHAAPSVARGREPQPPRPFSP